MTFIAPDNVSTVIGFVSFCKIVPAVSAVAPPSKVLIFEPVKLPTPL